MKIKRDEKAKKCVNIGVYALFTLLLPHKISKKKLNQIFVPDMEQFTFEETNLICCYRKRTRADTVAAITAALLYMETEIQELAERTAEKLKKLTGEEFDGLVFLPAEDME